MLARIPVTAALVGLLALLMLVPALYGAVIGDWRSGRGFLYPGLFGGFLAAALGVLLRPVAARDTPRNELMTLLMVWVLLPFYACVPLVLLTPAIGLTGAWFEAVSALTTSGGTVYGRAGDAPAAVHLWRGLMGWFGGLLTLMAAYVVLAPRRLGGYEVLTAAATAAEARSVDLRVAGAAFHSRVGRALRAILPVYLGMTLALAAGFGALGQPGLVAAVHAMSVVSTSGISPVEGGFAALGGFGAEALAMVFMIAAATRLIYADAAQTGERARWRSDPELRLMAVLVGLATLAIFLRHWAGVLTISETSELAAGARALWGALFTCVSFITTTGFESASWASARDWSGLANPGLILLGLAAVGGGAATTAGGVKLIRAYALLRHGLRELERIAVPSSVAGLGYGPRQLRREGAVIAWAFMMLFILALMLTVLALTLTGPRFSGALVAAVAALSNTGPLFKALTGEPLGFAVFNAGGQAILAAAMVLGRIETIAVIAFFNPDSWSRITAALGGGTKRTGKIGSESPLSTGRARRRPRGRRSDRS